MSMSGHRSEYSRPTGYSVVSRGDFPLPENPI